MPRTVLKRIGCFALLLMLAFASSGQANADHPLQGKWKFRALAGGSEISIWIFDIEEKDGKLSAQIAAGVDEFFKAVEVKSITGDAKALHLVLENKGITFKVDAYPAPQKKGELWGSVEVDGQRDLAQLTATDEKEIDAKTAQKAGPAAADVKDAAQTVDPDERAKAFDNILKKYPHEPVTLRIATELLKLKVARDTRGPDLVELAKTAVAKAEPYGPEIVQDTYLNVAKSLSKNKDSAEAALGYLSKATAALPKDLPSEQKLALLEIEARALRNANKVDQADKVAAQIEKIETQLDEAFKKTAIPFTPTPYKGRTEKSEKVVVVELFTGAQCPPCVAADIAFDALLKTYQPRDVLLLQYHLHVPGPDPLTNDQSETRADFYEVPGTPALQINGKEGPAVGGYKQHAEESYKNLTEAINDKLEEKAQVTIGLQAKRTGEKIAIEAKVEGLEKPGKDLRLRFVLLEDEVRYLGGNQQRLHHNVVRTFPGGVKGVALDGKVTSFKTSVDLDELRASLKQYLENYAQGRAFGDETLPLNLNHLKVVAFIQDDETKQILNGVQVNVAP